jgi:Flp pilus assembly protein TadD
MPHRWNRKLVRFVLFGSPLILAACTTGSMPATIFGPASDMEPVIPEQTVAAPVVEEVDPAELLRIAQDLRAKGDVAGAAHFFAQAHQANPDDVSALIGLGDMLAALGDSVQAADAFGKATAMQPAQPDARLGLAKASIAMHNPQVAATQFQAVLSENGQDVRAYNGLGVAADMMGDHKAAQEHYRAGLAIDPQNVSLLNNLGLSLALSGDFDNGIFMLEELAAAPDASPTTRQNLALAYGLAGRDEEAERVARVDLGESEIRKNLAFIASHRGGSSGAITKALNVELTQVAAGGAPAVVRPEQAAEVQREAVTAQAEATLASAEPDDGWYYEEPIVEAAPTVAVDVEQLEETVSQLADASGADTARAMRGLSAAGGVALAAAALPTPSFLPEPAPEPLVPEVAEADAIDMPGETQIAALPVVETLTHDAAPAAAEDPVVVSEVARSVPVPGPAGAVPRALLAMPVATLMANAPSAPTAIVPTPVTVYDAVPATQYCKDAGIAVVNCLVNAEATTGRTNGAMILSAAFDFAGN